jgi:L-lactate utilization protein LutB
MVWDKLADDPSLKLTAEALKAHGFNVIIAESGEQAKKKVLELIPPKSEVMTASSVTVEQIGMAKEIEDSGKYASVRKRIAAVSDEAKRHEARRLSAAPDYVTGSVHAVTQDGKLVIVSNTGSQLGMYATSAAHVVFVVGTQKIVKDLDQAMRRIHDYVLPLEDERLRKLYGMGSAINKILVMEKEVFPGRVTVVLVKEKVGF